MFFYSQKRSDDKRKRTLNKFQVDIAEDGGRMKCGSLCVEFDIPRNDIDLGVRYIQTEEYIQVIKEELTYVKKKQMKDVPWKNGLYQLCEDVFEIQLKFAQELKDRYTVDQILYMWKQVRCNVVVGMLIEMVKE